ASWLDKSALVLCDVLDNTTHERVRVAPRSILQRQIEAAEQQGYLALAASELEYYMFETKYREAHAAGYRQGKTLVPMSIIIFACLSVCLLYESLLLLVVFVVMVLRVCCPFINTNDSDAAL